MEKLEIEIEISRSKLEAWVARKIGVKRATLPTVDAAKDAIDEFLKENSLYGAAPFSLKPRENAAEFSLVIKGEGGEFQKTCQLLEKEFSTES